MLKYLKYAAIIMFGVALGLMALLLGQRPDFRSLKDKLRDFDGRAKRRKELADQEHEAKIASIKDELETKLKSLEEGQRAKADRLRNDPDELARWLSEL